MTDTVRVSVGLPVFNGARYLEAAIDSLLAQSLEEFELIISDNASTDATESICRAAAERDPRVRYVRNRENLGAAANFNRVVDLATAPYFKWAAHDDLCGPDFLRGCVGVLDRDPGVVLAYPTPVRIDGSGRVRKQLARKLDASAESPSIRFGRMLRRQTWCLPVFGVMRTEVLRGTAKLQAFPGSDHVLLCELALLGRFHEVLDGQFFHRDHDGRYVRIHASARDRLAWWDPARSTAVRFPRWTQLRAHLAAIDRSGVSGGTRARCYLHLLRWMGHNRKTLGADVLRGLPVWDGRGRGSRGSTKGHHATEPAGVAARGSRS